MFEGKRIYLISWDGYGHPEWDILADEQTVKQIIVETIRSGYVRPDIYEITVEEVRKFLFSQYKGGKR